MVNFFFQNSYSKICDGVPLGFEMVCYYFVLVCEFLFVSLGDTYMYINPFVQNLVCASYRIYCWQMMAYIKQQ